MAKPFFFSHKNKCSKKIWCPIMMKYSSTLVDKKKREEKKVVNICSITTNNNVTSRRRKKNIIVREFEKKNGEIEEYIQNNSCSLIQSCVCVLLCMFVCVWWWKKLSKFPFFACQLTAKPASGGPFGPLFLLSQYDNHHFLYFTSLTRVK